MAYGIVDVLEAIHVDEQHRQLLPVALRQDDRLVQAIATHDQQLAGLQGQVTNPAAVAAIVQARDRAAQALQTANQPASSNGGSKPSAAPTSNGNGKGPGPSATPHPTPKH